jgi:hypothetical protein
MGRDFTWRRRWLALAGCLVVEKTKAMNKRDMIFAYFYYKILYEFFFFFWVQNTAALENSPL